jgi:membrane protease YdiL (CAAX protease family)
MSIKNIGFVVFIAIVTAVAGYLACHVDVETEGVARVAYYGIGPTLVLGVIGAYVLHRDELLLPLVTFRPGDFTRGFLAALVLFGGTFAATHFFLPLSSNRATWLLRVYLQLGDPKQLRDHVPAVVVAMALAALAEEVVFRGIVPALLEGLIGSRRAWIYSAVLFAAVQLPAAYALRTKEAGLNPLLPAAALGSGLVWGYMTRRWGRLWPAIISHALVDWCVIMMFRLYGPSV